VCCNTMIVAPAPAPAPKPQRDCGLQNRESFLWSSTLLFKQYPNFVASYKCRVSLVHPKVAVTAAHCLQDKGYYQVRIGGTIRTVARVVVHPSFKQVSLQNDVALLVLDKPFKMDKAGVVCVPSPGSLFDSNNCTATTRTSEEDGSLRMIRLSMVSRDECVDLLRKTRLGGLLPVAPVVHLRRGRCGSGHVRRRRRESPDLCCAGGSRAFPAGRDSVRGDRLRWKSPGSLRESGALPGMDRRGLD
jgi:hypothetical protein